MAIPIGSRSTLSWQLSGATFRAREAEVLVPLSVPRSERARSDLRVMYKPVFPGQNSLTSHSQQRNAAVQAHRAIIMAERLEEKTKALVLAVKGTLHDFTPVTAVCAHKGTAAAEEPYPDTR
ncbi:hypothetical protein NDU88_004240 [Pleurodeles waltl]|uniref:Uncharacterized protein n=1 Tax=Pleurodeles waltl TaxID=8319 RepID=A0AAV7NKF9_PLEWA|nr:hypothetical protein NDU88_004240 [Pleurodeles waltl]